MQEDFLYAWNRAKDMAAPRQATQTVIFQFTLVIIVELIQMDSLWIWEGVNTARSSDP